MKFTAQKFDSSLIADEMIADVAKLFSAHFEFGALLLQRRWKSRKVSIIPIHCTRETGTICGYMASMFGRLLDIEKCKLAVWYMSQDSRNTRIPIDVRAVFGHYYLS
jgi:hypothetical protein